MKATHINRRDITLDEIADGQEISFVEVNVTYSWEARLHGRLSTGEHVEMTRTGATSAEALANLEAAIKENGWVIE